MQHYILQKYNCSYYDKYYYKLDINNKNNNNNEQLIVYTTKRPIV